MSKEALSGPLKVVSVLSIALGPYLSQQIPMASDLRTPALWFSACVSVAVLLWFTIGHAPPVDRRQLRRDLFICCAAIVLCGFGYVTIHLLWTRESGTFTDKVWMLGLIATFGLSVGSITGAVGASGKLTEKEKP